MASLIFELKWISALERTEFLSGGESGRAFIHKEKVVKLGKMKEKIETPRNTRDIFCPFSDSYLEFRSLRLLAYRVGAASYFLISVNAFRAS